MKKVLSIVTIAVLSASFVACGPSKEELEKREQAKQDSITAVEKAKQDSIAAAEAEAELAAQAAEAAKAAEAARVADSLANTSKKGKKK